MKEIIVEVVRRLLPMRYLSDGEHISPYFSGEAEGWHSIQDLYRVLVLAEPGMGKTFEARERAKNMRARGRQAFFIRIEKIDATFDEAFEVGTSEDFTTWLGSTGEAWFFLDSVDEAQLETSRAFEDAIKVFGDRIYQARERAHVTITSRDDAWEALSDLNLVTQYLPHSGQPVDSTERGIDKTDDPLLKVYRLGTASMERSSMEPVFGLPENDH